MIANKIWAALDNPEHYIEPCFGSGAVLLARPGWTPARNFSETVNDINGFVSNVWRALKYKPAETAEWADYPVNHADLIARRKVLLANESNLLKNLVNDDVWCDPKIAGYWIWAASCWIGSGLTCPNATGKRPHLAGKGMGVHKSSVVGKIPHLADKGVGVHKSSVTDIYDWFEKLSERLRYVRVVCGDWSRVCGGDWQDKKWKDVGLYFDPPYSDTDRDDVYGEQDSFTIGLDIEKWCIERGARSNYRIVVSGYDTEYKTLVEAGWRTELWKTGGGYSGIARNGKDTRGKQNRRREMLFYSPHCHVNQDALDFGKDE